MRTHAACPGFEMHRCLRCSNVWASNSIGHVINMFCPNCIPDVTYVLADDRATIAAHMMIYHNQTSRARHTNQLNGMRAAREHLVSEEKHSIQSRRRTA